MVATLVVNLNLYGFAFAILRCFTPPKGFAQANARRTYTVGTTNLGILLRDTVYRTMKLYDPVPKPIPMGLS